MDPHFQKLIAEIKSVQQQKYPVFVAISGFGGSGKSTLADKLKEHFNIRSSQIVRLDHLYSKNPDGPGILDQVDWELLKDILEKAQFGERLHYVGKGYRGEVLAVDEELPNVVIVEGIRLLQRELIHFFDVSVWIDCPQEIALGRAKERDRRQGEDKETVGLWDSDWGPKDRAYFETHQPEKLATMLFPTHG